jgi:cytochrome b subunit of formate dehydrogenase
MSLPADRRAGGAQGGPGAAGAQRGPGAAAAQGGGRDGDGRRGDSAGGGPLAQALRRFTGGERWVHWSLTALMGICIVTAAFLYVGPLAIVAGRRRQIELVHVYAGLGLPLPLLLGWLSRAFRQDLRRLNRFSPRDWAWLRSRDRRSGRIVVGKFNAGQKLNAAFTAGSVLLMLGTGVMLAWPGMWPLSLRVGATFVHDWLALAILIVVAGHIWYATRDPEAMRGMWSGAVTRSWASRNHAGWLVEQEGAAGAAPRSQALDHVVDTRGERLDVGGVDRGEQADP